MKVKARITGGLTALFVLLSTAAYAQYAMNADLSADETVKVSPHVWMIKGFPNIGIIVGEKATLVVDTGMGPKNGAYVAQTALKLSPRNAKLYLTTTHYHPEHASGDVGLPAGSIVIRPRVQQQELEAEGHGIIDIFAKRSEANRAMLEGAKIKPADIVFDNSYTLDLGGGVKARLLWFGTAHTKGDEVVMADPDSVLITGDVVQNKTGPAFACADCTPKKWLAVLDQMLALNPKIVMPDHSPVGDGTLIKTEDDFMRGLVSRLQALKAQGTPVDDAKKILAAEYQAKYPDWVNMNGIPAVVEKGYAED
jgi:glyoxylase-like metal-dependent hydrolase (beta-lactamase superfamily II)